MINLVISRGLTLINESGCKIIKLNNRILIGYFQLTATPLILKSVTSSLMTALAP